MKDFRDLKVWEKAHKLTLEIYGLTATFPQWELYGLTSQIRRCSASIGANIAEGCESEATMSSNDACKSHRVRQVNGITTSCLLGI